MNKLAISVLMTSIIAVSMGLDCSHIITKEAEGVLNWFGRINWTVPVSTGPGGWGLTLFFDESFNFIGVWGALGSYNGTEKWAQFQNWNASDAELEAGSLKSIGFRVVFDRFIPPPQVISLRFQDIELCT